MEIVTIANVSGFIAVAIVVSHFLIPNLLIILLSNSLGSSNNAVTWSVAGRTLHNSSWPSLLRTEAATFKGVKGSVRAVSLISTLAVLLISVAGIVTPLGLYQAVVPGNTQDAPFSYAADHGPFGYGKMPRSDMEFNRRCGWSLPLLCPGIHDPFKVTDDPNGTMTITMADGYDGRIPKSRYDFLQSGLNKASNTISSIWDIEWRGYNYLTDLTADIPFMNGSKYMVGAFQNYDNLILHGGFNIIEGLVVDSDTGAIGFRNHSLAPLDTNSTASWREDLLFMEPESVCIPNNLTLQITIGQQVSIQNLSKIELIDNGGFSGLDLNLKLHINGSDQHNHFDLWTRAARAAYINNILAAAVLNLTDLNRTFMHSKLGDSYNIPSDDITPVYWDRLHTSSTFSDFFQLGSASDLSLNNSLDAGAKLKNPNNVTSSDFLGITDECQWFGPNNPGNMSTIAVGCNMAYGLARPLDANGSPKQTGIGVLHEPGTLWNIDLYSCATAVKANIKTVEFEAHGMALEALEVKGIAAKDYPSQDEVPWWGVEHTSLRLLDAAPLWGMADHNLPVPENMTIIQKDSLYLPGLVSNSTLGGGTSWSVENLPGVDFHSQALQIIGQIGKKDDNPQWTVSDYSGVQSQAMYRKWETMTDSAKGMAEIHQMIWGDIAANAVIGTKGMMGSRPERGLRDQKRDAPHDQLAYQEITISNVRVQYHWPFAIPAFLVSVVLVLVVLSAVWSSVANGSPLQSMNYALQRTSVGRVMTTVIYPEQPYPGARTEDWVRLVGMKEVRYQGAYPVPGVQQPMPQNDFSSHSTEFLKSGSMTGTYMPSH